MRVPPKNGTAPPIAEIDGARISNVRQEINVPDYLHPNGCEINQN
jgi:hypothetical protein